jgi:hypothetical protein
MLLRPTASLCHRLRCAAQGSSVPLWRSLSRPLSVKVTTDMIKELRAATGAPMMECKAALADPEVGPWQRAQPLMEPRRERPTPT